MWFPCSTSHSLQKGSGEQLMARGGNLHFTYARAYAYAYAHARRYASRRLRLPSKNSCFYSGEQAQLTVSTTLPTRSPLNNNKSSAVHVSSLGFNDACLDIKRLCNQPLLLSFKLQHFTPTSQRFYVAFISRIINHLISPNRSGKSGMPAPPRPRISNIDLL